MGLSRSAPSAAHCLVLQHGMKSSWDTCQLSSDVGVAGEQRFVKGEKEKTPAAVSAKSLLKIFNRCF